MAKRTKKNLQNTTQKTTDRATWTPLKTGVELSCTSGGRAVLDPHVAPLPFSASQQLCNLERKQKSIYQVSNRVLL
jgi:hypothetical protein